MNYNDSDSQSSSYQKSNRNPRPVGTNKNNGKIQTSFVKSPYIQLHSSFGFKQASLSSMRSETILRQYQESPQQFQTITNLLRIKFRKQITKVQKQEISLNNIKTLVKNEWIITPSDRQQQSKWIFLFNSAQNIYAFQIICRLKQSSQCSDSFTVLLNAFVKPRFNNLIELVLDNSKINSIQFISFLDSPNIQTIWLNNNNIVSFKPLQKIRCKQFYKITIMQNLIKQLDLSRFNLQNNKQPYILQFQEQSRLNKYISNYSVKSNVSDRNFLAKLQTPYGIQNHSMNGLIKRIQNQAAQSMKETLRNHNQRNRNLSNRRDRKNNYENDIFSDQQQRLDIFGPIDSYDDSSEFLMFQSDEYYKHPKQLSNDVNGLMYFSQSLVISLQEKFYKRKPKPVKRRIKRNWR